MATTAAASKTAIRFGSSTSKMTTEKKVAGGAEGDKYFMGVNVRDGWGITTLFIAFIGALAGIAAVVVASLAYVKAHEDKDETGSGSLGSQVALLETQVGEIREHLTWGSDGSIATVSLVTSTGAALRFEDAGWSPDNLLGSPDLIGPSISLIVGSEANNSEFPHSHVRIGTMVPTSDSDNVQWTFSGSYDVGSSIAEYAWLNTNDATVANNTYA